MKNRRWSKKHTQDLAPKGVPVEYIHPGGAEAFVETFMDQVDDRERAKGKLGNDNILVRLAETSSIVCPRHRIETRPRKCGTCDFLTGWMVRTAEFHGIIDATTTEMTRDQMRAVWGVKPEDRLQ